MQVQSKQGQSPVDLQAAKTSLGKDIPTTAIALKNVAGDAAGGISKK